MLLVVLYHARVVTPGGFVGVDVFFVISGFVIGRRLIARLATPGAAMMGEFYLHRARRILPALSVLLVAVILAAPLFAPIGGIADTSPTGIAAALFSANAYLYSATAGGYFAPTADQNPLLHTWSLSVEEQLYFVIPVMLLTAWVVGRRRLSSVRSARIFVGALLVSSLVLCVALSGPDDRIWGVDALRFAFFSPFTRAWEFAAGLLLALLPVELTAGRRARRALLLIGLGLIGFAAFTYSDATPFPGYAALVPVLGAALVIHAGTRATPAPAPVLSSRLSSYVLGPMRSLGDVSYSWYLWHWPLIVFAGALWPEAGAWPLVAAGLVSLAPAWWSYRSVEHRFRATPSSTPRATVTLAAWCIALPLVAALAAVPIRSYIDGRAHDSLGAVANLAPSAPGAVECNSEVPLHAKPPGSCTWRSPSPTSTVALIGDSNAAHFDRAVIGASKANDAELEIAVLLGCPFTDVPFEYAAGQAHDSTPDACLRFNEQSVRAVEANPPDVVVVGTATDEWVWAAKITPIDPQTGEQVTQPEARARIFEDSLVRLTRRLRASGSRVVLLDVVPKPPHRFDPTSCSNLAILVDASRCLTGEFATSDETAIIAANELQAEVAQRTGAETWGFEEQICPRGLCRSVQNGVLVWRDESHLSAPMSDALVPAAAARLRRTLAAASP